jgi:hypothetical protein
MPIREYPDNGFSSTERLDSNNRMPGQNVSCLFFPSSSVVMNIYCPENARDMVCSISDLRFGMATMSCHGVHRNSWPPVADLTIDSIYLGISRALRGHIVETGRPSIVMSSNIKSEPVVIIKDAHGLLNYHESGDQEHFENVYMFDLDNVNTAEMMQQFVDRENARQEENVIRAVNEEETLRNIRRVGQRCVVVEDVPIPEARNNSWHVEIPPEESNVWRSS